MVALGRKGVKKCQQLMALPRVELKAGVCLKEGVMLFYFSQ
jgi:hypothetical protein